jgi:hypothetical protein
MIATIIDSLIVVLLIGSIGYGYVVSMKLRKLTATLKQLEPLVEQFSSAVDKSEQSVPPEETAASFASRRATKQAPVERNGVRVVRDKKEMVRAFFENSSAAKG